MDRTLLQRIVAELHALCIDAGCVAPGAAAGAPPPAPGDGDAGALLERGRDLLRELRRGGILVPVEADGAPGLRGPLYLVRGSTRLIDLAILREADPAQGHAAREETPEASAPRSAPPSTPPQGSEAPAPVPTPPAAAAAPPPAAPRGSRLEAVLDAMEQAQDLRLGDPGGDEREVVLAGILGLLSRCLPDLRLLVRLPGEGRDRPEAGIVYARAAAEEPPWLATRPEGAALWIASETELPPGVRELLAPPPAAPPAEGVEPPAEPAPFPGAVAVPLREPAWAEADAAGRPEAGLLIVAPAAPLERGELLAVARRLSGFVTRRWRRLWELNRRIHTDGLTGVRNRAFFDGQFALEIERARRTHSPLALVLCDLDHFKAVNDRHGHPVGDRVLVMVAQAMQDVLRRIDHVCRIGGEEFALVLPETSPEQAREAVARVMRRLDTLGLAVPGQERPLRVTVSCGVATFPDSGTDSYDLFRKADAMLYRSKRTGRHRCHFWNRRGEPTILLPGREPPSPS